MSEGSTGFSCCPVITPDGRYVAFSSGASNLVAGDTNSTFDVFVRDLVLGTTERVSVSSNGIEGDQSSCCTPTLTPDGRIVAFTSGATNLVAGDTNGVSDIFVHDRQMATTVRASVGIAGMEADGDSYNPDLSGNGRLLTFGSAASNLVSDDANGKGDIFVRDLMVGSMVRVSVSSADVEGDADSGWDPRISADGSFVVFPSLATNLVFGDTNGVRDLFLHTLPPDAESMLQRLIDKVAGLAIHEGTKQSLLAKLSNAKMKLAEGQVHVAVNILRAFQNAVTAQRGKKIPAATADELVADAQAIIDALVC